MPVAREQPSTAMFDYGECPETIVLQLEDPLRIIEGNSPLQEWDWLELELHGEKNRITGHPSSIQ